MDIVDDRTIAKLQFHQTLFNSIENNEYVTRNKVHVGKTEKACVEKKDLHAEVLNGEEAHANVINEKTERSPLTDIDAPTEPHNPCDNSKRIEAWLTALSNVDPASKEESLPPVRTFNTILDNYSDDEEGTTQHLADGTNPFRSEDAVEEVVVSGDYDREGCSAELLMENFVQRIQSRAAVPQYALVCTRDPPLFPFVVLSFSSCQSDSIFWLDKPKDAVSLHDKLPVKPLPEDYEVDGIYTIVVTEVSNSPTPVIRPRSCSSCCSFTKQVYSPFQFWFQFCEDSNVVENLCQQLS